MPERQDGAHSTAGRDHWFEDVADHLGSAYLRYSFTKGTDQEVGFLVEALDLKAGCRLLDVGCGPGRHSLAFARLGIDVVGVDISRRFIDLATEAATTEGLPASFQRVDARTLPFDAEFDAVVSLCQGAFGLAGGPAAGATVDPDARVLDGMARALKQGSGRLAMSAFSSYFAVRFLEEADTFDAGAGVNHERTSIRSEEGIDTETDLWTTCFTPRELRLLCAAAGLDVEHLWAVTPGRYAQNPPDLDHPEWLVIARRPFREPGVG